MGKLSPTDKKQLLQRYLSGEASTSIAKDMGVTPSTILFHLKRNGIVVRSRKERREHRCDENYFDVINSEEKAYWLGFIVADGNVYKNTISIMLSAIDKDHLIKFAKAIGYPYHDDYRVAKNAYRIRVNSKHMATQLAKLGVVPNKSSKIVLPDLPQHLTRHFLRGFFDGDGSFATRRVHRGLSWYMSISSICFPFLRQCQKHINGVLGFHSGHLYRHSLTWCGRKLPLQIATYLYHDADIYLPRKFDRFLALRNDLNQRPAGKWQSL